MDTQNDQNEDVVGELIAGYQVTEKRVELLRTALELGAAPEVLEKIRDAVRVKRVPEIVLPVHRLETLSRGRGYCGQREGRRIRGPFDSFADRVDGGYLVTSPGRWVVGGHDGFSRKATTEWDVVFVTVGEETWVLAS
jgi:hypothetical protein